MSLVASAGLCLVLRDRTPPAGRRGRPDRGATVAPDRQAREHVARLSPVRRALDQRGKFTDASAIPTDTWLEGVVDLDAPEHVTRFARNPRITRGLSDLGYGQELGEGVRRMFDEMRLAGLKQPEYRQTAGSVTLTCRPTLSTATLRHGSHSRRVGSFALCGTRATFPPGSSYG
jgi:hypothetical protein